LRAALLRPGGGTGAARRWGGGADFFIRQGAVSAVRGIAELSGGAFAYEAGDLFPLSAAVARRAVTATYSAAADTFVLALPGAAMWQLAQRSPPFADFLNRRIAQFLELSRRALQVAYSSQALAEQSLETPLGELIKRAPVSCSASTPLQEALAQMHRGRIGSSAGARMGLAPAEYQAWSGAFEFLQMLRLRVQLGRAAAPRPNRIASPWPA